VEQTVQGICQHEISGDREDMEVMESPQCCPALSTAVQIMAGFQAATSPSKV